MDPITLNPGESISFSMPLPSSWKEGKCWNSECGHYLSWGGSSGWAKDCPYCGWTAEGAPKDSKWMKLRWPQRYAELRAREFERTPKPVKSLWSRMFPGTGCDHDWVKTDAVWHTAIRHRYYGGSFVYQDATECTGMICDKCGERSVKKKEVKDYGTYYGLLTRPHHYHMNDHHQGPLFYDWPSLPPWHFRDIPEIMNGNERSYEDAFGNQIAAINAGASGYRNIMIPML